MLKGHKLDYIRSGNITRCDLTIEQKVMLLMLVGVRRLEKFFCADNQEYVNMYFANVIDTLVTQCGFNPLECNVKCNIELHMRGKVNESDIKEHFNV